MFWVYYSTSKCSWNVHNSSEPKVRVLERNTSDGVNPTIVIQFGSLYSSILGIQPCTIMNNRCKNASWLQWMAVVGDPKYREDYSIYFDHRQLSNFTCNWDKEHACINLLKVHDESCCVCIESVRKHGTLRQWWMKAAGLTDSTMWWLYNNQQQHRLIAIPCDSWWASSFCHVYFLAMSGTYYVYNSYIPIRRALSDLKPCRRGPRALIA